MVISKKDLKNPKDYSAKYDNVSDAAGKLVGQGYVDNRKFDEMQLHKTDAEARKVSDQQIEEHKTKPRIIYG